MVIKLYIDYISQPSRAVLALCTIAKIPHQVIEVKIIQGENRTPQFKKINPMKLVPAIFDTQNNLALAQSHSILKYLCQKYKVGEQWYPLQDIAKQAKINQFLDFHHLHTRKCSYLVFHTVFAPISKTGDPTFNSEWSYKVVKASLKFFSDLYLKDNKYLGGEKPCIADLIAFYDITMLQVLQFDYSSYPKIVKWIGQMRKIPQVTKVNEKFEQTKDGLIQLYLSTKAKPKL